MVATAKLLIANTLYVITASKYNDIFYNCLLLTKDLPAPFAVTHKKQ